MCGGRGTRLDASVEKPLVPIRGVPMVDRVRTALADARVETVHAVVSPHTPATRDHLRAAGASVVDAPGEGYVADLASALDRVGRPAVTVAADLPLLAPEPVNRVLDAADGSLAAYVPVALKRRLGASVDADATVVSAGRTLAPVGLNVVAETDDDMYVSHDPRLAVNVNRPSDRRLAEARCP
ncbi:MAG: NTP transferase domain-containing protein [Haloplanus sp.]